MRICYRCKQIKNVLEFGKIKGKYRYECKKCHAEEVRKRSPESRKKAIIRNKKYRKLHRKEINKYKREYQKANKIRAYAHNLIRNLIWKKKLKRQVCEKCSDIKSEAHHPDYFKPLEVIWLCRIHHAEIHGRKYNQFPFISK